MIRLVDTHCHLDFNRFDADRSEVVQRAQEAGVDRIIVPAVDIGSNRRVVNLAQDYPPVNAAVGIHPNDIPPNVTLDDALDHIKRLAQQPKVIAIGEIGLDYYWKKSPPEIQHEWLRRQLDLAAERGLPVILHDRETTTDIIRILNEWTAAHSGAKQGVMHSFSGTWDDARTVLDMGFYLGFTGPITYKKGDVMREVASKAPSDRILIETDAPFLSPQSHRSERNEPAYVRDVAEKLADVRSVSLETIAEQTTANAFTLFGLAADTA